jgi:hypothetical protein
MARTYRNYPERTCLRNQRNKPHKREQALINELVTDDAIDFILNLGNRARFKAPPEPYDDRPVAALAETKYLWR